MIQGIIIGFLFAILIVVTQIYMRLELKPEKLRRKIKQTSAILNPKPETKADIIIKQNEAKGKDTPLDDIYGD
ncbi:MAG: hypothetical protein OEV44_01155 [Spirochaetota bacterium]|nr:hypothetical protein [Spirochaetota bacterium]